MKQLIDLERRIQHPETEATAEQINSMPTYRRLLRFLTLSVTPKNIEESDRMHQVRMKLSVVETTVNIEDAEFEALKRHVDTNTMQWQAHVHHEMVELMRDTEKRKVDVTVTEQK